MAKARTSDSGCYWLTKRVVLGVRREPFTQVSLDDLAYLESRGPEKVPGLVRRRILSFMTPERAARLKAKHDAQAAERMARQAVIDRREAQLRAERRAREIAAARAVLDGASDAELRAAAKLIEERKK